MSYFCAGLNADASAVRAIDRSMLDVVPPDLQNNVLRMEGGLSFLKSFGSDKVISDIAVRGTNGGSWLAILGTPLGDLPTEASGAAFIDRFLRNPGHVAGHDLDGCFALLAYDAANETFYAVTDSNNTIPIYYSEMPVGILVSSHELALARSLRPKIDPLGFSMSIHVKLTWGSHTRFQGLKKLLPCQILTFSRGQRVSLKTYWRPSEESLWTSPFGEIIDRWGSLLKDSLRAYYRRSRNKTVLCDFTGGEDSRLVLSGCHAVGIPFVATVDGREQDPDARVAQEAARRLGFELIVRPKLSITDHQLRKHAVRISLMNDGYQDYFESCSVFATDEANPPRNYAFIKFCGAPGGEAYRGSYYLRGKILFPSRRGHFDSRFFIRMKFLLDYFPGLLDFPDEDCRQVIFEMGENALKDVPEVPSGLKIDHLIRLFQTCHTGLIYKNPRYLPLASWGMTRSVYSLPPHLKRGGKLTKACTEVLYPEIAFIKTRKGVPTVRKTPLRTFLFWPEYLATAQSILSGAKSRLWKWTESNKSAYMWNQNAPAIRTLMTQPPFAPWFASSGSMITGPMYRKAALETLLADARSGSTRYVPILGRIINQELACRWVYGEE